MFKLQQKCPLVYFTCIAVLSKVSPIKTRDSYKELPVDKWGSPRAFANQVLKERILEVALSGSRPLAHHAAVVCALYLQQLGSRKRTFHEHKLPQHTLKYVD